MNISIKLTVFFEEPFWVGIFERVYEERYYVSRVVFDSEPKDYDVYDFVLKNFYSLRFSKSLSHHKIDEAKERRINSKRLKRRIKKETKNTEIGTKAQLAIKLQHEAMKLSKRKKSKEEKEKEEKRKFLLRQKKKLMRHKGH